MFKVIIFVSDVILLLLNMAAFNYEASLICFILLCWMINDMYHMIEYETGYGAEYGGYYSDNNFTLSSRPHSSHYDSEWGYNSHSYNSSYNSYYKQQQEKIKMSILSQLKPNMSIVLEDEEKNKKMIEAKSKPIELKTINPTPTTTVVTSSTTTTTSSTSSTTVEKGTADSPKTTSYIVITNTTELSQLRVDVYKAIITFLKEKKISDGVINILLDNIPYIDIVDTEVKSEIFIREIKLFKNYGIDLDEMVEHVRSKCRFTKPIAIVEYKHQSVQEYYWEYKANFN